MDTNSEKDEQVRTVSTTIRMDAVIHDAVKRVADKEGRSLTKQIERALKQNPQIAEVIKTTAATA